jgi:hypothetical protein
VGAAATVTTYITQPAFQSQRIFPERADTYEIGNVRERSATVKLKVCPVCSQRPMWPRAPGFTCAAASSLILAVCVLFCVACGCGVVLFYHATLLVHITLGDFGQQGKIRQCAHSCAGAALTCYSAPQRDSPCIALHQSASASAVAHHLNLPRIGLRSGAQFAQMRCA